MYFREVKPKIAKLYGNQAVNTSTSPRVFTTLGCQHVLVTATTQSVYVSTLSTAPASTDCFQVVQGGTFEFQTGDVLESGGSPFFCLTQLSTAPLAGFSAAVFKEA